MNESMLSCDIKDGVLLVSGLNGDSTKKRWFGKSLGGEHLVFAANNSDRSYFEKINNFSWIPTENLLDLLTGLCDREWSGVVNIGVNGGFKRLFFRLGEIIFARSSLVDDRLGEIIYRNGDLSLNDLADSSAKVSGKLQFGQILISSGLFSQVDLWNALKLQVEQIVQSVFLAKFVSFEILEGKKPSSEVFLDCSSKLILRSAFGLGRVYREFISGLELSARLELKEDVNALTFYPQGSFLGDFLRILDQSKDVKELLDLSKLQKPYTLCALQRLVNEGFCLIEEKKSQVDFIIQDIKLLSLEKCFFRFDYLIDSVGKEFQSKNKDMPLFEIKKIVKHLNKKAKSSHIFLNTDGTLHKNSKLQMLYQAEAVEELLNKFKRSFDILNSFLLHLIQDTLGFESRDRVKKQIEMRLENE